MEWVLVCVGVILAVEVFLHTSCKKNLREMLDYTKRSTTTITSARISDHWKEKVLGHYALKIFINSLQLLFSLLLTASPIIVLHFMSMLFGLDVLALLTTPLGLIISFLCASLYIVFRAKVLRV